MTYNHAYTIGFAVPESNYEDWEDCLRYEKAKVISAMIKRIWLVMDNDQEFMEALDGFDTFEE
jgi:hypothetical protein